MVRTRWRKMSSKKGPMRYICDQHKVLHYGKCAYCLFADEEINVQVRPDGKPLFMSYDDKEKAYKLLEELGLKEKFDSGEITEVRYPEKHQRQPMY